MLRAPASSHCPPAEAIAGLGDEALDFLTSFIEMRNVDDRNTIAGPGVRTTRTPATSRRLSDSSHESPNRKRSLENPDKQRDRDETRSLFEDSLRRHITVRRSTRRRRRPPRPDRGPGRRSSAGRASHRRGMPLPTSRTSRCSARRARASP
jgi:hypothetical protein